jgi:hypothetical protein
VVAPIFNFSCNLPGNTPIFGVLLAFAFFMEKIVISPRQIADTPVPLEQAVRLEAKLASVVPWWAKLSLSPLVLALPLLCLVTIVLRTAMRSLPPRTRHGWTAFLSTLLVASGLLTSVSAVLAFSFVPLPSLSVLA